MAANEKWEAQHFFCAQLERYLDVGCNVGALAMTAKQAGVTEVYGVDINASAVEKAKQNSAGIVGIHFQHSSADSLPFPDHSMQLITACEVLEHVPDALRTSTIQEIHRILEPGGEVVITVPYAGLFSFLDPANVRFHFPQLYQLVHRILGGSGREAGFAGQKHHVVWHKHFHLAELNDLLSGYFTIEQIRYRASFLVPLCDWLLFPFYRRGGWLAQCMFVRFLQKLQEFDYSLNWGPLLAYNILVKAKRNS